MRLRIRLLAAWLCLSGPAVAQTEPHLVVQANLPEFGGPVAISPDGNRAAIGNRIWDLESGMRLYEFRPQRTQMFFCQTQSCSGEMQSSFVSGRQAIGFSPDSRYFAISRRNCSETPGAAVWDLETGKLLTPVWRSTEGGPLTAKGVPFTERDACQWTTRDSPKIEPQTHEPFFESAGGNLVAKQVTAGQETRLVVQLTKDGSEVWSRALPAKWYGSPAFSADGHYLVYQYDEIVEAKYYFYTAVEDLRTKQELARFAMKRDANIAAHFSPKLRWLCLPTSWSEWVIVDTNTWKPVHEIKLEIPKNSLYEHTGVDFAFSPDESWILFATGLRYDVNTGESHQVLKAASVTPVNSIALSKDENHLASGMYGERGFAYGKGKGSVVTWPLAAAAPPVQLRTNEGVYAVSFTPEGKMIVGTENRDVDGKGHELHRGSVSLWDLSTQQQLRAFTGPNKLGGDITSSARLLALSAGGKHLAAASRDILEFQDCKEAPCGNDDIDYIGLLHVWDPETGSVQLSKRIDDGPIEGLAISPKGQNVATVTGRKVRLWNLPQLRATWETGFFSTENVEPGFLSGYDGRVTRPVVFSPDGKYFVVGNAVGAFSVWNLPEKEPKFTAYDPDDRHSWVSALAFSADSKTLFVGNCDGSLRSFQTSGWEKSRQVEAHEGCISEIVVDDSGRWLATASLDGTVRMWAVPELRLLVTLLFDAIDGEWLVVASDGVYDASKNGGELAGWRVGKHITPVDSDPRKRKLGLLPLLISEASRR